MKLHSCAVGVALLLSTSAATFAAATVDVSGDVSVNVGGGYRKIVSGATVAAGSRLAVQQNGGAILTFDNGCQVTLRKGQVYTVPSESPTCAPAGAPPPEAVGGFPIGPAAIGGLAVAGVIAGGVVAATSGKSTSNPVYISR